MAWDSGDAVDAIADGVVIFDRDGSVRLVNRAAEALFGVDRSACLGRPFAETFSLTNRDGSTWLEFNSPFEGPHTRTGVPEQSWVMPDGTEALITARIRRDVPLGRPPGWPSRSARGAAASASTGTAPTWWPPWPTSCAPRSPA